MVHKVFNKFTAVLAVLVLLGSFVTFLVAFQDVTVGPIDVSDAGLSLDEEAYYEYVAPRLDVLVEEINTTVELVETKSRDFVKLSRAGNTIETLTAEIRAYGEESGVPPRFAAVHDHILDASTTINESMDAARKALLSFKFSGMADLIESFKASANEFVDCQSELTALIEA